MSYVADLAMSSSYAWLCQWLTACVESAASARMAATASSRLAIRFVMRGSRYTSNIFYRYLKVTGNYRIARA